MNLVARAEELKLLNHALEKKESQFIAVYGRRRVGKTFLVREAFEGKLFFMHTGFYNRSKTEQLEAFFGTLKKSGLAGDYAAPKNWIEAFDLLEVFIGQELSTQKKIIFLDEVSWMDTTRSDFIPALEHFWNAYASARKDIVLIICSSATSWIIDHVIHSRGGLHNRLTLSIHLQPFTLAEVEEYMHFLGVHLTRMQILEGYMILGGIPYYWSHIEKGMSIEQYIDFLFFRKGALLRDEFDYLFSSLFNKPGAYIAIIHALASKRKGLTRGEILEATGLPGSGETSKKLTELENCDIIRIYTSYGERKGTLYQLIDPFILFYYHFMEHRSMDPQFWMHQVNTPMTNTWKGLAFEMVCLLHVQEMKQKLGIGSVLTDVFSFVVKKDLERGIQGSQIDLVLKRADKVTNLVEMKYSQDEYLITKGEDEAMRRRRSDYQRVMQTRDAIHLTMVSPYGVIQNSYAGNLDTVLTVDDLF
ncbi:MAG: ATP-binding protein [Clostridia bacterium]|nr:ATP-binding protein [Clostridia bacterium]